MKLGVSCPSRVWNICFFVGGGAVTTLLKGYGSQPTLEFEPTTFQTQAQRPNPLNMLPYKNR